MVDMTQTTTDYIDRVASLAATGTRTAPVRVTEPTNVAARLAPGLRGWVDRAQAHTQMGRRLAQSGRLRVAKRAILRIAHLFSQEQIVFNESVVHALTETGEEIAATQSRVASALGRVAAYESTVAELQTTLRATESVLADREERFGLAEERTATLTAELTGLRASLRLIGRELRQRAPEPLDRPTTATIATEIEQGDSDQLYSDLEARFRGSRAAVRAQQTRYLRLFTGIHSEKPVLDVGPGRCEWLELLRENSVPAYGVEINGDFAAMADRFQVDVRRGEAVAHLTSLPDGSLTGITAFQVVEHLPFATLLELLDQALRVLIPGGILLLETPNPSNIIVGSSHFWLDPTHQRPIPAELLEFLVQQRGFVDVEIRAGEPRPDGEMPRLEPLRAHGDLFGPMDYAVIGRAPRDID